MKLLSLNVEGIVHIPRAMPFILSEQPDVICLQEAGTPYQSLLEAEGYVVSFMPRCIRMHNGEEFTDGLLFASLLPAKVEAYNFYTPHQGVVREQFDPVAERYNNPGQILLGSFVWARKMYHIGTTHFTWGPNGNIPGKAQLIDMPNFLATVAKFPAHIMCGDFNVPRSVNVLYKDLLTEYHDDIPSNCATSLDPTFHKLKDIPDQAHKLQEYMVDYIFSKPGYIVSGVRQVFGVSDHAATVCEVV
jgi:endonuclease/exonuclease/phosphatase family metal-dependent hydrolase